MDKKLANAKIKRILWMDLEMTGLDPDKDRILEVAVIVTDWDLKEIATFEAVVKVSPLIIQKRMQASIDFWDSNPTVRDALLSQNPNGEPKRKVEDSLIEFIDEHFDQDKPIVLAGNSIHQDRRFVANEWPRFEERLHYRMLDVSAWKLVFEGKFGKKFAKAEQHRALEDIRGSIQELQYYLGKIKVK
jgi:oligoribonuclease